jgi:hypothetical protein
VKTANNARMPIWINKLRLLKFFPYRKSEVIPSLINQDVMIPKSKDNNTHFGLAVFEKSNFMFFNPSTH